VIDGQLIDRKEEGGLYLSNRKIGGGGGDELTAKMGRMVRVGKLNG
jgi:hypothetical protein